MREAIRRSWQYWSKSKQAVGGHAWWYASERGSISIHFKSEPWKPAVIRAEDLREFIDMLDQVRGQK